MIRGIHYLITKLNIEIDVIPLSHETDYYVDV